MATEASGPFAVYGVTMTACRALAERRTAASAAHYLTQAEKMTKYNDDKEALAQRLYRDMKPMRLPSTFASPELAREFITLSRTQDQGRDFSIWRRHTTGTTKTGREQFEWRLWHDGVYGAD